MIIPRDASETQALRGWTRSLAWLEATYAMKFAESCGQLWKIKLH